jgi:hypothetical protein
MVRILLSVLCLFAVVGFVAAQDKGDKAGTAVEGKFKEWKNGTLTLTVGKPGEEKEQTFKILDDTKVTVRAGTEKSELVAKNVFSALKANTPVTIRMDANKQIQEIVVDMAK